MKKTIRQAIAILLAIVMVFALCSCTVGTKKSKTPKASKDGGVIEYDNLKTENGTAVYTFKFKDNKGKEKTNEVEIDLEETDTIEMTPSGDIESDKFLSGMAKESYHMSDKEAKAAAAKGSDYKEFMFIEYVQNKSEKTMAYKNVRVDNNGKNKIWIKTTLDAEYTIAPGSVAPIYVYGIADMSEYDEETLKAAFDEISVELEYTLVESAQDEPDWDKAEISTLGIH